MNPTPLLVAIVVFVVGNSGCSKSGPANPVPMVLQQSSSNDETRAPFSVGDNFPVFKSIDLNGEPQKVDKAMFGQKCTLVIFWSTWCEFCMAELPHEIELFDKYKDKGLKVIGVNADSTIEVGRKAAIENGTPWVNLYEGKKMTISRGLGVTGFPAIFLLDSNGKILARDQALRCSTVRESEDGKRQRTTELDVALEKLLADATAAK